MRFSCTKENLSQALSLVGGISSKNINLPILNNVLLKAEEQKVDFIATNLEVAVIVTVRAKIEEVGSFTVPAKTLGEFVSLLSADKVQFEVKENELVVSGGKSTTKIKGAPADEFPIIPTVDSGKGFVVDAKSLSDGLSQVLPASAKTDIRPELAGVLFAFNFNNNKGLTLAATDSYRLAEKKISLEQGGEVIRVIVPGRTAQEINRALSGQDNIILEKSARLLVGDGQISLNFGNIQIISRLVSGEYPDYTQIIPKDFSTVVSVGVVPLTKELRAAGLFTTTGVNAVTVEINPASGSLLLSSASLQTGDYNSELPAEIKGDKNKTVLNHRYVLEGLSRLNSETVLLKMNNSDSPCIVAGEKDDSFIYIVMPIRQ